MKNNMIVYGKYAGVQKQAIEQLSKTILEYTGVIPVAVSAADFQETENTRYFFIGTKTDNPHIKNIPAALESKQEAYSIQVADDTVWIAGSDDGGVLYGCIDFYDKYLVQAQNRHLHLPTYFIDLFAEGLPDFKLVSAPSIQNRGLWTWGHVIYDYKGYIDNMMRLKMNTVIIWNDFVPVNMPEIIDYAHARNVKVILGYSWFWDTNCTESGLAGLEDLAGAAKEIAKTYEKDYAHLGADGIYFQSFTEIGVDNINGVLIADAVTQLVNAASGEILAKYPDLELQFGLHASSVREKLEYIANVDPRVTIVWEDCGAFPYHYIPEKIQNFDETMDFAKKILHLRGDSEKFGSVLKGCVCLDWETFVHQKGVYHMGASTKETQRFHTEDKRKIWHYIQAYWLRNADKAYKMLQLMAKERNGDLWITALVEDGMFDDKIQFPVALLGEMLWDCNSDYKDILCNVALRNYVQFM